MKKTVYGLLSAAALVFSGYVHATPMTSVAQFDAGSTLINFDELSSGSVLNSNQYAGLGVTITGTSGNDGTGSATVLKAYPWDPIYIGSPDNGWDGSIVFNFSSGVTQFGLEIIDSLPSYLSVYGTSNNLLETLVTSVSGHNIFVGIDTGSALISKAVFSGSFYAIDDVRFNKGATVSEPSSLILLGLSLFGLGALRRKAKKA